MGYHALTAHMVHKSVVTNVSPSKQRASLENLRSEFLRAALAQCEFRKQMFSGLHKPRATGTIKYDTVIVQQFRL